MADSLLARIAAKVIFVDFHAEATSEKVALGWYLDGRVTAVIGTHTHIPTADTRLLPGGTAYQTDVGMTGPYDSVIGVQKEQILQRFLTGLPARFEAAANDVRFCAVLMDCDAQTGRARCVRTHHARREWQRRKRRVLADEKRRPEENNIAIGSPHMNDKRPENSLVIAAEGFAGNSGLPRGFDWRAFDAYLFDIDGTLLNSRDPVHYEAFLIAMREFYGRAVSLEGVTLHGSTDPLILLRRPGAGRNLARQTHAPHWPAALARMCSEVEARSEELRPELCPAVTSSCSTS